MTEELVLFLSKIPDYSNKTSAMMIDYFAFFLQKQKALPSFTASQIKKCFELLSLSPYSNINSYLNRNSSKKGKYIKQKKGYSLNRLYMERVADEIHDEVTIPITNVLLDLSLIDSAPYYIKQNAVEMNYCYTVGCYNACLVLVRKLIETLIIECFEKHSIAELVIDKNGCFFSLSELITAFLDSKKWHASRNINSSLKAIKKFGDLSAHNRRFLAKKTDLDTIKTEIRQSVQEIILTINY